MMCSVLWDIYIQSLGIFVCVCPRVCGGRECIVATVSGLLMFLCFVCIRV